MIFDEPTVGLDVLVARALLKTVLELREQGKCIVFSTHIMREAEKLCDRIAIVHRGHILAEGTRPELVALVGQTDRVTLGATGALADAASALAAVERVVDVTTADGTIEVTAEGARTLLPTIISVARL